MQTVHIHYPPRLSFPARRIAENFLNGGNVDHDSVIVVKGLKVFALNRESAMKQLSNHESFMKALACKRASKPNTVISVYKEEAFFIRMYIAENQRIVHISKGITNAAFVFQSVVLTCYHCNLPSNKKCVCGVRYCSVECQQKDWPDHKTICRMCNGLQNSVLLSLNEKCDYEVRQSYKGFR